MREHPAPASLDDAVDEFVSSVRDELLPELERLSEHLDAARTPNARRLAISLLSLLVGASRGVIQPGPDARDFCHAAAVYLDRQRQGDGEPLPAEAAQAAFRALRTIAPSDND